MLDLTTTPNFGTANNNNNTMMNQTADNNNKVTTNSANKNLRPGTPRPVLAQTANANTSAASTNIKTNKSSILPTTCKPRSSEAVWETYGFGKKEYGWGAWYLVP